MVRKIFSILYITIYVLFAISCNKVATRGETDCVISSDKDSIGKIVKTEFDSTEAIPLAMHFVDLGLPSGTLWGSCNIGATNINKEGARYAWGEVSVKERYEWDNYAFADSSFCDDSGESIAITKYNVSSTEYSNNFVTTCFKDGKTTLEPSDDIANALYGGNIPTEEQVKELASYCTLSYDAQKQEIVIIGKNSNTIKMPVKACWTSSLYTKASDSEKAVAFIYSERFKRLESGEAPRSYGFFIRPVKKI